MAKVIRKRWVAEQTSGLPRRDRRSCEYEVYLPDALGSRSFSFDGEVAADIVEAETAMKAAIVAAHPMLSEVDQARMKRELDFFQALSAASAGVPPGEA